jgi:site-specific DNA recombinase
MATTNEPRSFASIHRLPLEKRIAALEALPTVELRKAWRGAWRASPPKGSRRRLLMLGIAWQWQVSAEGGLPQPLARRLAALEAEFRQQGPGGARAQGCLPPAGAGARRPADPGLEGNPTRGRGDRDRLLLAGRDLELALGDRPRHHRQPAQRPGLLRPAPARPAVTRSAGAAKPVRCAIYTRKSTAEGLDQAFTSLDAQHEACAAYIVSQRHEGWILVPDRYDDGGCSGGSMDRPALRRLLADIETGRVDAVACYKVDRLTRSLADFARIVAIFDAANVSFVSVTQAFNTAQSMGRLILNVLLSFAQFERELAAERVRDKIAASKARGLWTGGVVPIGYRAEARALVPEPAEAALVVHIFRRYLALGAVSALKAELDAAGIRSPVRLHRNGGRRGGAAFSRGQLYCLLANPLFVGRIRHRDQVHPGRHAPIVDAALWQAVQERLGANRQRQARRREARTPSPLAGRLSDPDGRPMRPSHAGRNGRRYRYYVSAGLIDGRVAAGAHGWRIPAGEFETAVARALAARLRQPDLLSAALRGAGSAAADTATLLLGRLAALADRLEAPASAARQDLLRLLVDRVKMSPTALQAEAGFAGLAELAPDPLAALAALDLPPVSLQAPLRLQRRGPALRVVLQGAAAAPARPDPLLLRTLVAARLRAADYLDPARGLSVSAIARRDGADAGDVSRSLQLAFLAPDLVEAIVNGSQPLALTAERLKRLGPLPLRWDQQRALLGAGDDVPG